jgi:hypothetical protein
MNISIPLPLQIVLDDVGWWSGRNDWSRNGPFRTGIDRDHCVEDYEAIVSLGRQLGVKPSCAFVVCEWDTKNLLRQIPSATWMGKDWDNSKWIGPWLGDAAKIMREHRDKNIEITLHGVGHEYWVDGKAHRANWHDDQGDMWPANDLRKHLRAYQAILDLHGLGPMPDSFAPCAGRYRFDNTGNGFARLLAEVGVKYNGQPFYVMHSTQPTQHPRFGIEAGVITIDRGPDMMDWFIIEPEQVNFAVPGPICGAHWPNILHRDPKRSEKVVSRWVKHLKPFDDDFSRMLSSSSGDCWTQFIYNQTVSVGRDNDAVTFDFSRLDALGALPLLERFHVKIAAPEGSRFESEGLVVEAVWDARVKYFRATVKRKGKAGSARLRVGRCT